MKKDVSIEDMKSIKKILHKEKKYIFKRKRLLKKKVYEKMTKIMKQRINEETIVKMFFMNKMHS